MGWRPYEPWAVDAKDGKQKDPRSQGPWWLQWPYPPWSAYLQTTFTWETNFYILYTNGLWDFYCRHSPPIPTDKRGLQFRHCLQGAVSGGSREVSSRSVAELSLLQHQYGFSLPHTTGQRCQCSVFWGPAEVSIWGQHDTVSMQIGTVFSGHAPGGPMGRKRWGKSEVREGGEKLLVSNWLLGVEGWWWLGGVHLQRTQERKILTWKSVGFRPVVCAMYTVSSVIL